MEIQKIAVKEQLVKTVVKSGNGGAVWVPKNWLGQNVVVILPEKSYADVKEKVIHLLEPYLDKAIAVFLYGSYARHEETQDSDIDVLVVTKDEKISIDLKDPQMEVTVFSLDQLKAAVEKYPVTYYQIVQEAIPLINDSILEELKNIKINKKEFKNYIIETKEHIKSNSEFLELDSLTDDTVQSPSIIYSTFLRLRGIFIINCIVNHKKFSNKLFQKWLLHQGMTHKDFNRVYDVYRGIKNNKKTSGKIKISVAEKLLHILETEVSILKEKLYGKQKKEAAKRH